MARLAEKATRAFEAGEYAEARRCVGDLEFEARVGGNSLHPRDAARLASNLAVLDLLDTEREVRLDAAGLRDTLDRAESEFRAVSASDAEPADREADARDSRVLRANLAWAMMRCGGGGESRPGEEGSGAEGRGAASDAIPILERVFYETVATDDGSSSTETLHETLHVASMLLRALAASGSRAAARKALRILSVAEAMMTTPGDEKDGENADARSWVLRERARFSMTLGDLVTAREILRAPQPMRTSRSSSKAPDELRSLRARLAYLEGDGATALSALGEGKTKTKETTPPRDDARKLNVASVLELSGASATALFLLDAVCSRRGDGDARDDAKTQTEVSLDDGAKRAAAHRAGVLLLRAKKPAAAALRILAAASWNAAVGAPETYVRLAECACSHAARGDEVDEDEREAAAAFVAASGGVPLTFSGAQTYLDSALVELYCDDEDKASPRSSFRRPRLRAHAHAQRAYVCLALGKRLDALSSANEVLAVVAAAEKNAKLRLGDAKESAVEEDGFEGDELEAYARLAKEYAAEASRALGRKEEAANGSKASKASKASRAKRR